MMHAMLIIGCSGCGDGQRSSFLPNSKLQSGTQRLEVWRTHPALQQTFLQPKIPQDDAVLQCCSTPEDKFADAVRAANFS